MNLSINWEFVFVLMVVCNKTLPQTQVLYQLVWKEGCNLIRQTWLIPSMTFWLFGNKTSNTFHLGQASSIVLENYCVLHSLVTVWLKSFMADGKRLITFSKSHWCGTKMHFCIWWRQPAAWKEFWLNFAAMDLNIFLPLVSPSNEAFEWLAAKLTRFC